MRGSSLSRRADRREKISALDDTETSSGTGTHSRQVARSSTSSGEGRGEAGKTGRGGRMPDEEGDKIEVT